ncbi:TPA: hypothetical protein UMF67_001771 [Stenotrophomonas maltophilia]|nr:hypothetical protein [Stenotrophomonas maltophilia]
MGASRALVIAVGDSGKAEPCPVGQAVAIQALPAGPCNVVTPASIRFIFWRREGNEARPLRIRRILKPNTARNCSPYVRVVFETTLFSRAQLESGHVWGDWMDVAVPSIADASDPLWDTLSARDRARITNAVRNAACAA